MSKTVLIPGTGLSSSMYNRLDAYNESFCIDLNREIVKETFKETVEFISQKIPDKSIVVGYSLGARLAASAALVNLNKSSATTGKIDGLVLISFHAGISQESEKGLRKKRDAELALLAKQNLTEMYNIFDNNQVFSKLNTKDNDFLMSSRISDPELLSIQLENLGLGNSPDITERLAELRIPVLYVTGNRDEKYITLNQKYKKLTPFSFHFNLDSDHRVPLATPKNLSLLIKWFTDNVVNG